MPVYAFNFCGNYESGMLIVSAGNIIAANKVAMAYINENHAGRKLSAGRMLKGVRADKVGVHAEHYYIE